MTPEKSQDGAKPSTLTVTHPFGDRARLCSTSAFESEQYSCSAPLTESPASLSHRDLDVTMRNSPGPPCPYYRK